MLMMGVPQHFALSTARDYWQLLKPRIMYLVVFTASTGMIMAPGTIHPLIGLMSALCIAMGSGAAGALNMWFDSDIDAVMSRTKTRPIPSGRISRAQALECGLALSLLSVFIMSLTVNYVSAILLACSIAFYAVVYTMVLKRRTPQNIVIGGIAGAFPPVIGWTSVTGIPSIESLLLFMIIFLWTPPHFWALSLLNRDEYKLAGIPMMSVYSVQSTKNNIMGYSLLLFIVALLPGLYVAESGLYEIIATSLGAVFLTHAYCLLKEVGEPSPKACMGLFSFSIYYLFLIFSAIALCS
ncbi:protoheme IX farnesyltransferase [Anaplasma phagocytophilum str. CRT53-1]|uniref:Protoheme IX farnesyltransferase n=3 Tax=Anaplasma phagocytophilum TaxID=948 RepID=A0A0F3PXB9_ANAPH|nr:protoheme IX farnesyltransferase [Anaplasma phagocytophilum str. CRT53-1]